MSVVLHYFGVTVGITMMMPLSRMVSGIVACFVLISTAPSALTFAPSQLYLINSSRNDATKRFASGGMDSYLAQMAATARGSAPAQSLQSPTAKVGSTSKFIPSFSALDNTALSMSAISAMDASQSALVNKIASSIPDIAPKPNLSCNTSSGFTINGNSVNLDARDAPGPANIAWLSSLCVENTLTSLTIFNGPLTDVPHFISQCAIIKSEKDKQQEHLHFFLDFRPRAYGAYELRDNISGTYPGPETLGRKAFEYSAARKVYDTKFGSGDVILFLKETVQSFEGSERVGMESGKLGELERVTRGPLALEVIMPLSEHNINSIILAREKAIHFWLTWAINPSHAHRPGAPINSQYVYDTKYKQNAYGALLELYCGRYGKLEGEKLAAMDSGPLDEAYVGGGS